jgi:hypothetical protein
MTEPVPDPGGNWTPPPAPAPGTWPPPSASPGTWAPPPAPAPGAWESFPTPYGDPVATGAPFGTALRRESAGIRQDLPLAATVVVVVTALGVPAGLLWHRWSARPKVVEVQGGISVLPATDTGFFGVTAWFSGITAAVGIAVGLLVWLVSRRRGPLIPVALVLGGLAAAFVARMVGERPVVNRALDGVCAVPEPQDICDVFDGHLRVDSPSALVVWALAALAVHLALTALIDKPKPDEPGRYW